VRRFLRKKKASGVKTPAYLFRVEPGRVYVRHVVVANKQDKVARSVNLCFSREDMYDHFVELECIGQKSRAASFNGSSMIDNSHVINNKAHEYLKVIEAVQDQKSFAVVESRATSIVGGKGNDTLRTDGTTEPSFSFTLSGILPSSQPDSLAMEDSVTEGGADGRIAGVVAGFLH